ncbi:bromodomain associated domain protein [Cordyceps militaris CM01]|uniref:Transcription initiation factor TFIID subunit 8 n=2 Tax=Cordyceps militaris TaxID=73501 RepID=G3J5V0_CORMM|nr:bromodomain associated domain protein [Cordyceps militaris CM01]ATY65767.1 bromodomain associated domain [Cordyceps militaris]EGX96107.1 bromodomain associated domain protein [Cordyceps militaris CM01]
MTDKRDPPPMPEEAVAKRRRVDGNDSVMEDSFSPGTVEDAHFDSPAAVSFPPTQNFNARCGIQRSIALVASHLGFESTSPQVMESFTGLVEAYLESIIEETKRLAIASRREHPIPSDFENMLNRYNLPISSLMPHLRSPISVDPMPTFPYHDNAHLSSEFNQLPLLGSELSGQADKDAKSYIPASFPDFPSKHTYKFTPQADMRSRDSQKIREEAALSAQQGEDALRRLVRASKMRKQKEAKTLVERDNQGKERFRLWESTMKRFMGGNSKSSATGQVEIADHSMIVNGDVTFSRKDVPRISQRSATVPGKSS